jgi:deazaflavin-dependent oxidoreductase (nitroreductase family)
MTNKANIMKNKIKTGLQTISGKLHNLDVDNLLEKLYIKTPIYTWRLGLGPIVGRYIMIITQVDHKSGNPYKTSMEYFQINGMKYIANNIGIQSKLYRNILADPRVTIQSSDGTEQMVAVPVIQDDELINVIESLLNKNPSFINRYLSELGVKAERKDILKHKEELIFLRFDPTSDPTPRGLEVDLAWIWPLLLIWTVITKPKRKK